MFVRPLPLFVIGAALSLGCTSPATPPQSPTTITVPKAPENTTPEVTGYHCDGNPFHIGDKDYCAYDTASSWREAQRSCDAISARLLTFSSDENFEAVRQAFGSPFDISAEAYWIGLSEIDYQEGSWQWINGQRATYTHWNEGEPNDTGDGEDCAEWRLGSGSWNDAPCWEYRKFICQQRGTTPLTCIGTMLHVTGGDICFSGGTYDWESAKQQCREFGGELMDLSTQQKDSTLHKAVGPKLGLPSIWIGYNDIHREGDWHWISGSRYVFDSWKNGEPNDFNDEDCAQWFPEDGLMNDFSCSARLPYVCERIEK